MLPVNSFEIVIGDLRPGDLLFTAGRGLHDPRLVFAYHGHRMALALTGQEKGRFTACDDAAMRGSPLLRLVDWRLDVDPAKALTGTAGDPQRGSAYLDGSGSGFIGSMNHADIYVSSSGQMFSGTPDWGSGIVTFTDWSVVVGLPRAGHDLTVFTSATTDFDWPEG